MVEAMQQAGAPHKFLHYRDRGHMFISADLIEESVKYIHAMSA